MAEQAGRRGVAGGQGPDAGSCGVGETKQPLGVGAGLTYLINPETTVVFSEIT